MLHDVFKRLTIFNFYSYNNLMKDTHKELLSRLGFSFSKSGVHKARTMMLEDLELLFEAVTDPAAARDEYVKAIVAHNFLKKRSVKTRQLSAGHLKNLYALDPSVTIFRALRFFWQRDSDGHPLIALLCAYARNTILKSSVAFILNFSEGKAVTREAIEAFLVE
jgi:hypothetical protein